MGHYFLDIQYMMRIYKYLNTYLHVFFLYQLSISILNPGPGFMFVYKNDNLSNRKLFINSYYKIKHSNTLLKSGLQININVCTSRMIRTANLVKLVYL